MAKAVVAIMMGSDSDMPVMGEAVKLLESFGVGCDVKILSAHRTPKDTIRFTQSLKKRGIKAVIAGAGGAAHLAGVVAAHTQVPVIGVPMETAYLKGIDSLFSTVQMPSGVPVGCMAIGKAGAKNAAIFVLQILGNSNNKIYKALEDYRKKLSAAVRRKNK